MSGFSECDIEYVSYDVSFVIVVRRLEETLGILISLLSRDRVTTTNTIIKLKQDMKNRQQKLDPISQKNTNKMRQHFFFYRYVHQNQHLIGLLVVTQTSLERENTGVTYNMGCFHSLPYNISSDQMRFGFY